MIMTNQSSWQEEQTLSGQGDAHESMMESEASPGGQRLRLLVRFLIFFVLWCAFISVKRGDLFVGLFAAFCGTIAADRLLGAPRLVLSPTRVARFLARFLRQSLLAGIDVAGRAFAPSLPLATGFVIYRPLQKAGAPRDFFVMLSAMMPGTLPVGRTADEAIIVHCLDVTRPIVSDMSADETRFVRLFHNSSEEKPSDE